MSSLNATITNRSVCPSELTENSQLPVCSTGSAAIASVSASASKLEAMELESSCRNGLIPSWSKFMEASVSPETSIGDLGVEQATPETDRSKAKVAKNFLIVSKARIRPRREAASA